MECQHTLNVESCTCTATGCPRHGICCECLRNHLAHRQFPRCVFPADMEVTDRSFEAFAQLVIAEQV
jgi:hypothetical protein